MWSLRKSCAKTKWKIKNETAIATTKISKISSITNKQNVRKAAIIEPGILNTYDCVCVCVSIKHRSNSSITPHRLNELVKNAIASYAQQKDYYISLLLSLSKIYHTMPYKVPAIEMIYYILKGKKMGIFCIKN